MIDYNPQNYQNAYKNVQSVAVCDTGTSIEGVLLHVLKSMENKLQERRMLTQTSSVSFNPLWFFAETERNVYLWRKGCSLVQLDEFEFWIKPEELISKRIKQLENCSGDNPFINPLFGLAAPSRQIAELEKEYLLRFSEILEKTEEHMFVLSHISSALQGEFSDRPAQIKRVSLPLKK